jgi:hypothetical protein
MSHQHFSRFLHVLPNTPPNSLEISLNGISRIRRVLLEWDPRLALHGLFELLMTAWVLTN